LDIEEVKKTIRFSRAYTLQRPPLYALKIRTTIGVGRWLI